jgi:transcriptional regulator of arginine metabolism
MQRKERHHQILSLIHAKSISSQMELSRHLAAAGCQVTQATLSRDLHELNLVKTAHGYKLPEDLKSSHPSEPEVRRALGQFMTGVATAGNLVVIKTHPGNASPLAIQLDAMEWPEIMGTLAGDDTILVVARSLQAARLLQRRLTRMAQS